METSAPCSPTSNSLAMSEWEKHLLSIWNLIAVQAEPGHWERGRTKDSGLQAARGSVLASASPLSLTPSLIGVESTLG